MSKVNNSYERLSNSYNQNILYYLGKLTNSTYGNCDCWYHVGNIPDDKERKKAAEKFQKYDKFFDYELYSQLDRYNISGTAVPLTTTIQQASLSDPWRQMRRPMPSMKNRFYGETAKRRNPQPMSLTAEVPDVPNDLDLQINQENETIAVTDSTFLDIEIQGNSNAPITDETIRYASTPLPLMLAESSKNQTNNTNAQIKVKDNSNINNVQISSEAYSNVHLEDLTEQLPTYNNPEKLRCDNFTAFQNLVDLFFPTTGGRTSLDAIFLKLTKLTQDLDHANVLTRAIKTSSIDAYQKNKKNQRYFDENIYVNKHFKYYIGYEIADEKQLQIGFDYFRNLTRIRVEGRKRIYKVHKVAVEALAASTSGVAAINRLPLFFQKTVMDSSNGKGEFLARYRPFKIRYLGAINSKCDVWYAYDRNEQLLRCNTSESYRRMDEHFIRLNASQRYQEYNWTEYLLDMKRKNDSYNEHNSNLHAHSEIRKHIVFLPTAIALVMIVLFTYFMFRVLIKTCQKYICKQFKLSSKSKFNSVASKAEAMNRKNSLRQKYKDEIERLNELTEMIKSEERHDPDKLQDMLRESSFSVEDALLDVKNKDKKAHDDVKNDEKKQDFQTKIDLKSENNGKSGTEKQEEDLDKKSITSADFSKINQELDDILGPEVK